MLELQPAQSVVPDMQRYRFRFAAATIHSMNIRSANGEIGARTNGRIGVILWIGAVVFPNRVAVGLLFVVFAPQGVHAAARPHHAFNPKSYPAAGGNGSAANGA